MSSRMLSSLDDEDAARALDSSARHSGGQREQLEHLFKAKFEALRTGYNERLRRLQQMVDDFHRQFVGDEVVRAMQEDASTSVYVPAHIAETVMTGVAEEKEQYIHELITQLGASEMNHQELAIECRDWKERARALQREMIKMQSLISEHQLNDSHVDVLREELDRLREKVAEDVKRQHEIAGLKRTVQERDGVLEASHAELTKAKAAIANFKQQQTQFDAKYRELQGQLDTCRQQIEAAGHAISQESSAREATERRMKDLLEAYRQLEGKHRAGQQAVGLAENETAFLQQSIQTKDAEMDNLKRKLAAVMTQVEQMLDAEATENGNALEFMQDKLRKVKQKYTEEAKRYKRAATIANDELTQIRGQLDDARRDLRQTQEDAKSLRQQFGERKAEAEDLATRNKSLQAELTRYQNLVVPELEARVRDKEQRLAEAEERHTRVIKEATHRARTEAEREVKELEKVELGKREQALKLRYEELLEQVRTQNVQLREAVERQASISEESRRQYDQMVHRLQNENRSLQQSLDVSQREDRTQEISTELQAMHMKQMNEWHQRALDYQRQITELEMRVRDASEQREKLDEGILVERRKRAEIQNSLKTKELQFSNAQTKILEAQDNIDRLKAIVEKLQAKVDEVENEKVEAVRNMHAATQARGVAEDQAQRLKSELATADTELRSLRTTMDDMDSALFASHETSAALESDVRGSSERVKLMTSRVRELEAMVRSLKQQLEAERVQNKEIQSRDAKSLNEMRAKFQTFMEKHEQKMSTFTEAEQQLHEVVAQKDEQLHAAVQEKNQIQQECSTMKSQLEQCTKLLQAQNEQLVAERAEKTKLHEQSTSLHTASDSASRELDTTRAEAKRLRTALELTARSRDEVRRRLVILQDATTKSINSFRYAIVTMKGAVLSDLQACRADSGRLSELVLRACSQALGRSSRKHEQQLASLKQHIAVQLKLKESDVEKQQGTVMSQMQAEHRRQLDQLTASHTAEVERLRKLLEDRDAGHQATLTELHNREQMKLENLQGNYQREAERLKQQHGEAEAQAQRLQAAVRDLETKSAQWHTLLASALESVHSLVSLPAELIPMMTVDDSSRYSPGTLYSKIHGALLAKLEHIKAEAESAHQRAVNNMQNELETMRDQLKEERDRRLGAESSLMESSNKMFQLESRLRDADEQEEFARSRSRVTEELERSRNEIAMLAELTRLENENEIRTLKSQLDDAKRRYNDDIEAAQAEYDRRIEDTRQRHSQELKREQEQRQLLSEELQQRTQTEREKRELLQKKFHESELRYREELNQAAQRHTELHRRFEQAEMDFAKLRIQYSAAATTRAVNGSATGGHERSARHRESRRVSPRTSSQGIPLARPRTTCPPPLFPQRKRPPNAAPPPNAAQTAVPVRFPTPAGPFQRSTPVSRADSTSPTESIEEASPITFETRDELLAAIRRQVEYYFSKENLQSDAFLVSKMDANMSVPISVVMKFSKMRRLSTSEADLTEALSTSKSVHIVDDKIKANIKQERNTIILREIASDTPDAEIIAIFEGTRPVKGVRSDVGDTWFVNFENEDDAREALLAIRDRKFNGQSVKARLKVENILRSFYTPPAPGLDGVPVNAPIGMPFGMMGNFPSAGPQFGAFGGDRSAAAKVGGASGRTGEKGGAKAGKEKDRSPRKNGQTAVAAAGNPRKEGRRRAERGRGDRKEETRGRSDSNVSRSGLHLTTANFPPLPLVETPIPQAGYQGEFVQYTVDELLQIVQRISKDDAKLPEGLDATEHSQAMDTAPNMDLLLRQRTFSIDETREQLRQGRPVHRDAVIAGGVDYGALMYGEHYDNKTEESGEAAAAGAAQAAGPKGYAAALMAGAKAAPEQPVPMKATAKAVATPQKQAPQPQAPASAAKPAAKDAGDKDKPAKSSKSNRRGKGNRGGDREPGEAQPAKAGKAAKKPEQEQPEKPSTWGGRPTFLDVLKKQESNPDAAAPAPKRAEQPAASAAPASEA